MNKEMRLIITRNCNYNCFKWRVNNNEIVYVDNYFILMYTIPDLSSYISFNFMVAETILDINLEDLL